MGLDSDCVFFNALNRAVTQYDMHSLITKAAGWSITALNLSQAFTICIHIEGRTALYQEGLSLRFSGLWPNPVLGDPYSPSQFQSSI